jgi:hypothetical protein
MHATAMEHPSPERRSEPRVRTLKSGKIAFNRHFSVFDCLVRNLTPHGACLEVANSLGVPTHFDLLLGDGTTHPCRMIWRFGDRVGVVFE